MKTKKNEVSKCSECKFLKIKIEDLYNTLAKFTSGSDNLNFLLGNPKRTYDKAGLGYHPKLHEKYFKRFFIPTNTSNSPFVKCFYCGKK